VQLHDGAPGRRPAAASHAAEMPAYTTTRRRVRYETEPRGLETPRIRRDARPSGRTPRLASPEGTRIRLSQVEIGFPTSRRNPVAISQGLLHEAASSHFKRKASQSVPEIDEVDCVVRRSQAEARPRPLTPIPHRARAGRRRRACAAPIEPAGLRIVRIVYRVARKTIKIYLLPKVQVPQLNDELAKIMSQQPMTVRVVGLILSRFQRYSTFKSMPLLTF